MLDVTLRTFGEPDGLADYLSAAGTVLAGGVVVVIERDVERIDVAGGMIDRVVTATTRKQALQPFDRKGALRMGDGTTWYIDGIAADDGHLVTLYVKP